MKDMKRQIEERVAELERKYVEYNELFGYAKPYGRIAYIPLWRSFAAFYPPWLCITIGIALSLWIRSPLPFLASILVATIYIPASVAWLNYRARRFLRSGDYDYNPAKIIICFYTEKVLNEIDANVATVNRENEARRREKANFQKKVEQRRQENIETANRLRPQFEVLFEIIRTELEGKIKPCEPSDCKVYITLPELDEHFRLRFVEKSFDLEEEELSQLTFCVSQLRPVMAQYHSLQKEVDAAVLAKQ